MGYLLVGRSGHRSTCLAGGGCATSASELPAAMELAREVEARGNHYEGEVLQASENLHSGLKCFRPQL